MEQHNSDSLADIDVCSDRSESLEDIPPATRKKVVRWYHNVGDFINCLKAFIGTNYQALPFAFSNSGLAFGVFGVFLIAFLTDHCVQLLIRCKNLVINRMCREQIENGEIDAEEESRLRSRLQASISYGDLGKRALGIKAYHVIMVAIWFTQYMTVISYYIFIGNTVYEIFPMVPRAIVIQNGTHLNQSFDDNSLLGASDRHGHGIPMLHISNIGRSLIERHSDQYLQHSPSSDDLVYILNQSDVQNSEVFHINPNKSQYFGNHLKLTSMPLTKTDSADVDMKRLKTLNGLDVSTDSSMLTTTSLADVTTAHSETTDITEPTTANWTTRLPPSISTIKPAIDMISSAPDLRLIILFPLPFFLMTSLIRKVRYIAPLTSIATAALAVGAFSVLGFIIKSFRVADDFSWWKFRSLPLFLGQLIGAYEGIGCVIPIQSSMEGNRHLFPWFIHGAVTIVFFILCSFGALGYLVYGDTVSQIIVTNIAQHSLLAVLVDVTLVVSVLFTYPLQCFPVIEILETYLFSTGKCCGPRPQPREYEEISSHISDTPDDTSLLHERSVEMSADRVSSVIQPSVPAWKRNFVRILLSLISVGVAVLLRDAYAYISAFSGAVGASLLALIFPCLIHLSLKWDNLSMANKIKDYSIIAFAGVSSILTVVVIMFKMVKSGL